MTRSRYKAPSQRQLMVAEDIRHILATIMIRNHYLDASVIKTQVTVVEVRISPDLKQAKVYVMPAADQNYPEVIKALNKHASFYRTELGKQMTTKYTPALKFYFDETLDRVSKIEALFNSDRVKQDLPQN